MLTAHFRQVRTRIANLNDQSLKSLVMTVVLVTGTFVALVRISLQIIMRKLGFNAIADLDDGEIRGFPEERYP